MLNRRAEVKDNSVSKQRRWKGKGHPYILVEIVSKLGLPTVYLVVQKLDNGNEVILSRHRKRAPAEKRVCGLLD